VCSCIDAMLTNRYNNHMKLTRRLGKFVLTSVVIAGMMLSSCAEGQGNGGGGSGGIGHALHKAWDWFTGKPSKAVQKKIKKTKKLMQSIGNPSEALANVNIKAIPKEERKCFEVASEYSGVPLIILYTFAWKESNFSPKSVCWNSSQTKWDCGVMQANTQEIICPLAYRYTLGLGKFYSSFYTTHLQLFKAIQELGLKYVGGGHSPRDGNCSYTNVLKQEIPTLTNEQAKEYCSEVGTKFTTSVSPSNRICLGIMLGAYEAAYDYWLLHHSSWRRKYINGLIEKDKLNLQELLANAGQYADWIYVAYMYNGLSKCHRSGVWCYVYDFSFKLKRALAGGEHFFDKLFK